MHKSCTSLPKKNEHLCIVNKIIYEYLMKVKMAREKQNDLTVEKKETNRLHKKQNRRKRKKIDHKGIKKRHIVSIITLRIAKKSQ
jgi:hypothetical protein